MELILMYIVSLLTSLGIVVSGYPKSVLYPFENGYKYDLDILKDKWNNNKNSKGKVLGKVGTLLYLVPVVNIFYSVYDTKASLKSVLETKSEKEKQKKLSL